MRTTAAYLILNVLGSSNSSKTSGTGEGELGMTAGTPSLQEKGVSNTNHAALLILGIAADGHDVYLSLYPHGGGIISAGRFRGAVSDSLFRTDYAKRIYRIDGLDEIGMQAYLMDLNARIQAGLLRAPLLASIRNPDLAADDRARYEAELAALPSALGYDAFRHNCTTTVVRALRAGACAIPGVWFLETPTWLDGIARRDRGRYHPISEADFRAAITGRPIVRPHSAFLFEPVARLTRALGLPPLPPVERLTVVAAAGAGVGAGLGVPAAVAAGGMTMMQNPMMLRPALREAPRVLPSGEAVVGTVARSSDVLLESAARAMAPEGAAGVGLSGVTASAAGSSALGAEESKEDEGRGEGEGGATLRR